MDAFADGPRGPEEEPSIVRQYINSMETPTPELLQEKADLLKSLEEMPTKMSENGKFFRQVIIAALELEDLESHIDQNELLLICKGGESSMPMRSKTQTLVNIWPTLRETIPKDESHYLREFA